MLKCPAGAKFEYFAKVSYLTSVLSLSIKTEKLGEYLVNVETTFNQYRLYNPCYDKR